ncbi:glycosyltransferase family 2 protein [bacterium]|nr:MAG: glycosyltransferase family 2 protein [bacterium]
MKEELPFVTIITVNYNGARYLKSCIEALRNLDYPENRVEIIMVDNCSVDESISFVKDNFPEVAILKNDVNNYARANNLGINNSKGEFIAFVNNDVRVDREWLSELVKTMRTDRRAGAAGGKLFFNDHKIQSTGHEEYPDYYWGDRGFKQKDTGQYDSGEEVSSLCGAAILFRKDCLKEVGLFDEDFIMYLEDVDMCMRCAKKKWKIMYVPRALAYHDFRGTSSPEMVMYFSERNRLLLLAKHYLDKLGDALYGKGYFSGYDTVKQKNIFDLLPAVFSKIIEYNDKENILPALNSIFSGLKKISNLEKCLLLEQLESKDSLLREKEDSFGKLARDHIQLQHLHAQLKTKDELLVRQEASLSAELQKLKYELTLLQSDLDGIIRLEKPMTFLIIKPQSIRVKEAESVIKAIKQKYPNGSIHLFANLLPGDYHQLSKNAFISKIYQPEKNVFFLAAIMKFILIFWLKRFDVTLVLASRNRPSGYNGNRKAKLMALLSAAKTRHTYYTD